MIISQTEAEPLAWVHQTELFETAPGSSASGKPPYEGVLDWYPDVSSPPPFIATIASISHFA